MTPSLRPFRLLTALAALAALAAPRARADDPRSTWLEGRTYEKQETFVASGRTVEAYTAKIDEELKGLDMHRFLVVEGDDVKLALSARVDSVDETKSRVSLGWIQADAEAARVEIEVADAPTAAAYATAKRLAQDALAVWTTWTDASATLEKAIAEESLDARRPLALAATRARERAFAAHPDHAGLLHDLLVAYGLLLPLEAGTDRGANISFLWRERLLTFRERFAPSEDAYVEVAARALAIGGLAEGCYALAHLGATIASTRGDEAYAATILASLEALGQDTQESAGDGVFTGRRGELRVVTFRCPAEPPEGGIPFHRLTVLIVPGSGRASGMPTPVWYSLTDERTGERHRWALYGNVGGTRRLLRLYGATEPDADVAKQGIADALRTALEAEVDK